MTTAYPLVRNFRFVFFLTLMLCGRTASAQNNLIPVDKAAHFGLAAVSTEALIRCGQIIHPDRQITWQNRLLSSGIVSALSVAKEVADKRRRGDRALDRGDLAADVAGIVVGNILLIDFVTVRRTRNKVHPSQRPSDRTVAVRVIFPVLKSRNI